MRVGIDVRSTQSDSNWRGLSRYTFDLVASLVQHAPEHEYVLIQRSELPSHPFFEGYSSRVETASTYSRFWYDPRLPLSLRVPYVRNGVAVQRWNGVLTRRENRVALQRVVTESRLDLLHLPTMFDLHSFPAGRFTCPTVRTFHDATPIVLHKEHYDLWPPALKEHFDEQVESLAESAFVVADSESSRRDAIRYCRVPPEKVETVYCAVSDDWTRVEDATKRVDCRRRYGVTGDYFVFCSPNDPNKNVLGLVRAFAMLCRRLGGDGPSLVLVTSDEDRNCVPILKEAWRLGLSRREVVVTGRVPEDDLRTLFSDAVALVSPSLYEGFGLPAAQALRLGTPVLASNVASLPEVVGDAGLLFDPQAPESIADAMLRILKDGALRWRLAAKASVQGRRFSYERQARSLAAIYERVGRRIA